MKEAKIDMLGTGKACLFHHDGFDVDAHGCSHAKGQVEKTNVARVSVGCA